MWKKLLCLVLVCGLVMMMGACAQDDSGYNPEEDVDVEYVEDENNESSGNAAELVSRGTWNTEDASGYKIRGEITTTGLIRATDWGTVESTYDTFNSSTSLLSFDAMSPDDANQETSAVLIGMIELDNVTDGWDFTENNSYNCRLVFSAVDFQGYYRASLCMMYGKGMEKIECGGPDKYLNTTAVMKSNTWKVPFVMVIPNVFSPNEPNGSEQVLNTTLRLHNYGTEVCEFTMPGLVE